MSLLRRWVRRLRPSALNTGSVLVAEISQRVASFVLYAAVARALGVEDLGRLAIAVSVFQLLVQLAGMGIRAVIVRETAQDHSAAGGLFATGLVAIVAGSALCYGALEMFLSVASYDAQTVTVVRTVAFGLPFAAAVELSHAVMLGWERARTIAVGTVPVALVFAGSAVAVMAAGAPVLAAAWLVTARWVVLAVVQGRSVVSRAGFESARFTVTGVFSLIRRSAPFLGVQGANTARSNTVPLVLSLMVDEAAVGLFSAAHQLVVPVNLLSQAVAQAVYPMMARRWSQVADLRAVVHKSAEVMSAIVVPAAIGLTMLALPLIELVFGDDGFGVAADVLRIIAILSISRGLTGVLGQSMWASGFVRDSLVIAVRNLLVLVIATIVLVGPFGVIGAATAVALTSIVNYFEHVYRARPSTGRFRIGLVVWRPIAASAVMVGGLLVLSPMNVVFLVGIGVLIYAVALEAVYRLSGGSLSEWVLKKS